MSRCILRILSVCLFFYSCESIAISYSSSTRACEHIFSKNFTRPYFLNEIVKIETDSYRGPIVTRNLIQYELYFGSEFKQRVNSLFSRTNQKHLLKENEYHLIDVGSGFGVPSLELSHRGLKTISINAQNFWESEYQIHKALPSLAQSLPISLEKIPTKITNGKKRINFDKIDFTNEHLLYDRVVEFFQSLVRNGKHLFITGLAEEKLTELAKMSVKSEVIIDLFGAYFYGSQRIELIGKIYNMLKTNGRAYIQLDDGTSSFSGEKLRCPTYVKIEKTKVTLEDFLIKNFPHIFKYSMDRSVLIIDKTSDTELDLTHILSLKSSKIIELDGLPVPKLIYEIKPGTNP